MKNPFASATPGTDNPFAADQLRAWEQAMEELELDLGTHARPGLTWREVYKNTPSVDVWRRSPTRPPAEPPPVTDRQRLAAEAKYLMAKNALETARDEFVAAGGKP